LVESRLGEQRVPISATAGKNSLFASFQRRKADAAALADLARGTGGSSIVDFSVGGVSVRSEPGLAIGAGRPRADIAALQGAQSQAREGVSLLQAADAGLASIEQRLASMRALADQAAGADSDFQRSILQREFSDLRAEIDQIAGRTELDGVKVIDGVAPVGGPNATTGATYAVTGIGGNLSSGNGFASFSIAAGASNVSNGDVIRVEFSQATRHFTVTNTTTGQVSTAAGPSASNAAGQEVVVGGMGLVISLGGNFDPTADVDAGGGASSLVEFTVNQTAAATAAAGAASNVAAATVALGDIRAAVAGGLERFSTALDNADSMIGRLSGDIDQRLEGDIVIDTGRIVGEEVVDQGDLSLPEDLTATLRKVLLDSARKAAQAPDRQSSEGAASTVDRPGLATDEPSEVQTEDT
jgi:flagellin-like hook-associated protein FlgL